MRRTFKLVTVAAAIVGTTFTAMSGTTHALPPQEIPVTVVLTIQGADTDPAALAGTLSYQFHQIPGGVPIPGDGGCTMPITGGMVGDDFVSDTTNCALPPPDGSQEYAIGIVGVPAGYNVSAACTTEQLEPVPEQITNGTPNFTIDFFTLSAHCDVLLQRETGTVIVEKAVVNDDGGTAVAADFTGEVFASGGGAAVASGVCDGVDGLCLDEDLPTGDYVIGETGPAGYTATVACESVMPLPQEQIDDPNGAFTLEAFATVTCVITNDDVPPATTTTTTTPVTTTTLPVTTTIDAGAGTLPQTGASSTANTWTALVALVFVAAGGGLLVARRRAD